jgi:hypothetical protein
LAVGVIGSLLAFATRGFLRGVLWLDDPLGSVSTFGAPALFVRTSCHCCCCCCCLLIMCID